jgi:hypothetical protein
VGLLRNIQQGRYLTGQARYPGKELIKQMNYGLTDKAFDGLWIVVFNSTALKLFYSVDTLKELD